MQFDSPHFFVIIVCIFVGIGGKPVPDFHQSPIHDVPTYSCANESLSCEERSLIKKIFFIRHSTQMPPPSRTNPTSQKNHNTYALRMAYFLIFLCSCPSLVLLLLSLICVVKTLQDTITSRQHGSTRRNQAQRQLSLPNLYDVNDKGQDLRDKHPIPVENISKETSVDADKMEDQLRNEKCFAHIPKVTLERREKSVLPCPEVMRSLTQSFSLLSPESPSKVKETYLMSQEGA